MASVSSTSTLASWDPLELLELVNPDKLSITCVGYAPSSRRRCRKPIAQHNIQSAKVLMRQMVRPGLSDNAMKGLLFELAECTLCCQYHEGQAMQVSSGWFDIVQRHREWEDDHGSDTSDDGADDDHSSDDDDNSSTFSVDSDGQDDTPARPNRQTEQRQTLEDLERLQRELEDLIQRQRQMLRRGTSGASSASSTTHTQQPLARLSHTSEARRLREEQEARREAEQALQEEAYHRAQREREEAREKSRRERAERVRAERAKEEEEERRARREEAERKAESKAKLERERLRQEEAGRARLDRERQAEEREQQARKSSWEAAWQRYEQAWSQFSCDSTCVDADVRAREIWPTKSGSYSSCCEEDVKAFFRCQPGIVSRKMMRRQALRWHPDRAVRLFACVQDEVVLGEMMAAVTMISQVVIGIMAVTAQ